MFSVGIEAGIWLKLVNTIAHIFIDLGENILERNKKYSINYIELKLRRGDVHKVSFFFFFNCYLALPWPTLGNSREDSLTNPMLITAFSTILTQSSPGAS